MQGCFRKYPEVYGSELDSDADDDEEDLSVEGAPAALADSPSTSTSTEGASPARTQATQPRSDPLLANAEKNDAGHVPETYRHSGEAERVNQATEQVRRDHEPTSESEKLVPRAAHDASNVKQCAS